MNFGAATLSLALYWKKKRILKVLKLIQPPPPTTNKYKTIFYQFTCTGFFGRPNNVLDVSGLPPPIPDFPYNPMSEIACSSVHRQDYIEPKKTFADTGVQVILLSQLSFIIFNF